MKLKRLSKGDWIFLLIGFPILTLILHLRIGLGISWSYSLMCSVLISIVLFFSIQLGWIKVQTKDEKKQIDLKKEEYKKYSTDELRSLIKRNQEDKKLLEKEFDKRKDKKLGEIVESELWTIISSGFFIMFFSLFYFTALPIYFGVNNEFTSPSNSSIMGVHQSINLLTNTTITALSHATNSAKENPTLFFWLWWVLVFFFMVLPIIKIGIAILKNVINKKR